eukprot:CAMPEP_0194364980 /NCGR_PEP_ID=MMETSP0174-20130528/12930_1 /TAXON_ID=216777 /ORGANISM="Proboscia alata, Strain PI-D3" /LENGTH=2864 /DNA_ID=CAMNT_0039139339 /DNA_START=143 /DNA_END=8734 /DNA_ORIENTATION=+
MTEDGPPLEKVLNLLLPRLLSRIGSNNHVRTKLNSFSSINLITDGDSFNKLLKDVHTKIHLKLVEMLGHTMKRVRDDISGRCQIPCAAILDLLLLRKDVNSNNYNSSTTEAAAKTGSDVVAVDPFTMNLSLAFLTLGMPRVNDWKEMETVLLPGLINLLGRQQEGHLSSVAKKNQFYQINHLVLTLIQMIANHGISGSSSSGGSSAKKGNGNAAAADTMVKSRKESLSMEAGGAFFDLLLSTMLYRPFLSPIAAPNSNGNNESVNSQHQQSSSSLETGASLPPVAIVSSPPPGLSPAHYSLLANSGISSPNNSNKNWMSQMAPTAAKLRDLKLSLLSFVAPCRRWDIFDVNNANDINNYANNGSDNQNNVSMQQQQQHQKMGVSRAVVLMVVAWADSHSDVSQRGKDYLKAHLESVDRSSSLAAAPPSSSVTDFVTTSPSSPVASAATSNGGVSDSMSPLPPSLSLSSMAVGCPISVSITLLSLVMGGFASSRLLSNSNSVQQQLSSKSINVSSCVPLGVSIGSDPQQNCRRMVSEATAATLLEFVTNRILLETPRLFENDIGNSDSMGMASLAASSTYHFLITANTDVSGKTHCPRIASAKLLNALTVKLALSQSLKHINVSASSDVEEKFRVSILKRVMKVCYTILSSRHCYHAEVRDAIYGAMATLARCSCATQFVFSGDGSDNINKINQLESIKTAELLFECVAAEEERLRIRAAAALDALLGCYRREVISTFSKQHMNKMKEQEKFLGSTATQDQAEPDLPNPWATTSTTDITNNVSDTSQPQNNLSTNTTSSIPIISATPFLPLLWNAAQPFQPKASRLAVANWAKELLKLLDLCQACHLLCFLAGDLDSATCSLAKEGLLLIPSGNSGYSSSGLNDVGQHNFFNEEWQDGETAGSIPSLHNGDNIDSSNISENHEINQQLFPDFNHLVQAIFPTKLQHPPQAKQRLFWRPTYTDFSQGAKSVALRFGLLCLLNDLYGGSDDAITQYANALLSSLLCTGVGYNYNSGGVSSDLKSSAALSMDLLEDASQSLSVLIQTSQHSRNLLKVHHLSLAKLSMESTTSSAKARKHLGLVCGTLYRDVALWINDDYNNATSNVRADEDNIKNVSLLQKWTESCGIAHSLEICSGKLKVLNTTMSSTSTNSVRAEIHGAAHLVAHLIQSLRFISSQHQYSQQQQEESSSNHNIDVSMEDDDDSNDPTTKSSKNIGAGNKIDNGLVDFCWKASSSILISLGAGLCHTDETIGNACSQAIAIALSSSSSFHSINTNASSSSLLLDALILDKRLYSSSSQVLIDLTKAMKRYGHGDHTDASRALLITKAAGVILQATATGSGHDETIISNSNINPIAINNNSIVTMALGPARLACVDGLFNLLGSQSYRNESEMALVTGEALVAYADAYSPPGVQWTLPHPSKNKNSGNNGDDDIISNDDTADYDEEYATLLPPHYHTLYRLLNCELHSNNPHKRTSCASVLLAFVAHVSKMLHRHKHLLNGSININSSNGNKAVAMEEVVSGRGFVQAVLKKLFRIQTSFLSLMSDSKCKQLPRESCCLGLAACHGIASAMKHYTLKTSNSNDGSDDNSISDNISSNKNSTDEEALDRRLLRSFGLTTNFGGSAMIETREQATDRHQENQSSSSEGNTNNQNSNSSDYVENTEQGGVVGMSEAALGAYREMAAAALAVDRPDVLYSLLLLSVSHPVWVSPGYSSRYCASALVGNDNDRTNFPTAGNVATTATNTTELLKVLRPHFAKLVPRLLRGCHDPNKQTREQIGSLWKRLMGSTSGSESRSIIGLHLLPTIDTLISDASSKLWRARVGACGALAEVIVGRSWEELGGGDGIDRDDDIDYESLTSSVSFNAGAAVRLLRLWRMCTRALDDVRLNVRESGDLLARSVKSLTTRLSDPTATIATNDGSTFSIMPTQDAEESAAAAAGTSLNWLVVYGLNLPCAEATGVCVSALLGIIEVARPSTLRSVLPQLIGSLAMAISGLEPAALNYLQVRASASSSTERGDQLERLRLQMAQSGPISEALTKCLDMLRFVGVECQRQALSQLESAFRLSSGFASRAAVADAVTTLASIAPGAFSSSSSINNHNGHHHQQIGSNNPTVRLLRALYAASERERGPTARDKMAHALGSIAALAPGSSVRSLAIRACEKYNRSTGSNNDLAARKASASALRAIAIRAPSQFANGGNHDVWCTRVLPIAFLGQRDDDEKVAMLWREVWEEGGAATTSSNNNSSSDNNRFGILLAEKLLPYIVHEIIRALNDVSWERRKNACECILELSKSSILAPAPRRVTDRKTVTTNCSSSYCREDKELILRSRQRAKATSAVLTCAIRVLRRSHIWNGKDKLVKAIVSIVKHWISPLFHYCQDKHNVKDICEFVLGCEIMELEKSVLSPLSLSCVNWLPLSFTMEQSDDLFCGDKWFTSERIIDDDNVDNHDGSDQSSARGIEMGDNRKSDNQVFNENADHNCDKYDSKEHYVSDSTDNGNENNDSDPPQDKDRKVQGNSNDMKTVTLSGICRVLLEQAVLSSGSRSRYSSAADALPFRAASLENLADILRAVNVYPVTTNTLPSPSISPNAMLVQRTYSRLLYGLLVPHLIDIVEENQQQQQSKSQIEMNMVVRSSKTTHVDKNTEKSEALTCQQQPPLIVSRSLQCLSSAMWFGLGKPSDLSDEKVTIKTTGGQELTSPNNPKWENIGYLVTLLLHNCGKLQSAWTVREAAALAGASISQNASVGLLRKHDIVNKLLQCTIQTTQDKKFWKCRLAGLKLLFSLVSRTTSSSLPLTTSLTSVKGKALSEKKNQDKDAINNAQSWTCGTAQERQLMLEALLPHKERILEISRTCLTDNESKVTAVSSDICAVLAW